MADFTEEELAAEAATFDTQEAELVASAPARDEHGRFAAAEQLEEPAPQQQQERSKTVPHAALHAEREGHKATRAELAAAREQLGQLQAMRERIAANRAAPAQEQVVAPKDGEEDPNGLNYLKAKVAELDGGFRDRDAREQEHGVVQQENGVLYGNLMQSEAAFRAKTPDYDAAASHLANARASQLQMMGLQPHEVQQTLAEEVLEITRAAIQQGREPAELAYEWAKTYGYAPQGAQPAIHPTLAAIASGQKSRSLSSGRGAAPAGDVNAQAVAAMDENEFMALYNTPEGRKLIDAMG